LGGESANEEPVRKAVKRKWQCVASLTPERKTTAFLHLRKYGFLPMKVSVRTYIRTYIHT